MLDAFDGQLDLDEVLELPIPFIDDLFAARLEYLKEKRKAEADAMKAAQGAS